MRKLTLTTVMTCLGLLALTTGCDKRIDEVRRPTGASEKQVLVATAESQQ